MSRTSSKNNAAPTGSASLTRKIAAYNKWREQFNPLRNLTIRRAIDMGESYLRGEMANLQWTYFHVEQTDPDLLALIELRFGRLLEMDYNIKLAERAADTVLAEEQKAFLQERFDAIDNLYDAIEHLGTAAFRGFAHLEKWHGADGVLTHLEIVDQWNAVRDGRRGAWKYNPEARAVGYAYLPEANLMQTEAFVYREVSRPINRFALLKFVRAGLAEKDWDAYCEIYGIPGGVLIGPPNLAKDREDEFTQAAQAIAEGGSGYAPHGSDWKPNTAARGTQPFKERLDWLSEKLVLAGTGGKLTMLNGPSGLGSGQSDVHQQVFDTIAAGEARRISGVLNRQLVETMLEEKYPGKAQLAYFELAANTDPDVDTVIEQISKLAVAGFQVDEEEASEKTGYTLTLKPSGTDNLPVGSGGAGVSPVTSKDQPSDDASAGNKGTAVDDDFDTEDDDPDDKKLRNRAVDLGREELFKAESAARVSDARRKALEPILNRLLAIDQIADAEGQRAALEQFRDDLPALQRAALAAAPGMAETLAEIIGTALIDGACEQPAPATAPVVNTARGKNKASMTKSGGTKKADSVAFKPFRPRPSAQTRPSPATGLCKGRARPSKNS
jgi:phage gp29-like protein